MCSSYSSAVSSTWPLPLYRRRLQTDCKGCWTLPPELLVTLENSIEDWRQYYTTSSIGWMSRRGLSTSLVWQCAGVCMDGHLGTSQITDHLIPASDAAPRRRRLRFANLNRLTVPRCTVAGLFIKLARQSGTRCQMNLEILTASIVLNGFWKQSSLASTIAWPAH